MTTMFKFDVDELKDIHNDLEVLIRRIETINKNAESIGQIMLDSYVPKEYIYKIFTILDNWEE